MGLGCATAQESKPDVVLLGDSNTWLGGDDCAKPTGWNKWFCDSLHPASCRSYARSGATWTNTSETCRNTTEYTELLGNNNVIYNQICRLFQACDEGSQRSPGLILIAAGTNDAWFQGKRPHVFDKTADEVFADTMTTGRPVSQVLTLAESVRYACLLLRERFPGVRLVLMTPMESTAVPIADIHRAGDLIEACAHRMGVDVVRLDGPGMISRRQEQVQKVYTSDGTHTNERGARLNGFLMAHRVAGLLSQTPSRLIDKK
jgi:lysophospholipase L1-like esterase